MDQQSMRDAIAEVAAKAQGLEPDESTREAMLRLVDERMTQFLRLNETQPAFTLDPSMITPAPGERSPFEVREEGKPLPAVLDILQIQVTEQGAQPSSGGYMAYVGGGGVYPAALGDYIAAITNRFPGFFPISPGLVKMENELIRTICRSLGLNPEVSRGCLASGGTTATISAIVAARDAFEVTTGGVDYARWKDSADLAPSSPLPEPPYRTPTKFAAYYSNQTHSCVNKALAITGASSVLRRIIEHDPATYKLRTDRLLETIQADLSLGITPWLVVGSAGTVNSGSIDDLVTIGAIARDHNMWFHIDGAYGGLLALCPEGKAALQAPQCFTAADSIVVDPHKALFLPYGTGVVILPREPRHLLRSHAATGGYLSRWCKAPADEPSSADLGLELSKHNRSFRLWLPLATFGLEPFRHAQSEKIRLTQYFWALLDAARYSNAVTDSPHPLFEMGPQPELTICLYRISSAAVSLRRARQGNSATPLGEEQNELNLRLADAVRRDGRVFLVQTVIDGVVWMRICILSFRSHLHHIELAAQILIREATRLIAE